MKILGNCRACGKAFVPDRGDDTNRICHRCRAIDGKMADVFLAAAEGNTTRIPKYEDLLGRLRARYDDFEHPQKTDLELLDKLRGDLRTYLADSKNPPKILDEIDAREFIMYESISDVLEIVREWSGQRGSQGKQLPLEARALALLVEHPGWNDTKIAKELGCNRTSIYRLEKYKAARELQRQDGADSMPKGNKLDGAVEAWDE